MRYDKDVQVERHGWRELAEVARRVEAAALVTVVRTAGSAPRRAGAKMLVGADGELAGTIGGGRLEHEIATLAKRVAAGTAPASRVRRHLVRDLAMCCGGELEVWIEPLDGARRAVLDEAARRRAARLPGAVVTVLRANGGGKDLVSESDCLRTGRPRLEGDRFVEPVLPAERLVLFGAGHIAHATAPLAARVGFQVVVCDEDEAYATPARFPQAEHIVATSDVAELERLLGPLGPADYVVIATRDHALDQGLVESLLPRADLAYLGLVGSRGKLGRFRRRLEAKGLADPAVWARLHCPVGLDIGAETPAEIAVSIVAELVRERASR